MATTESPNTSEALVPPSSTTTSTARPLVPAGSFADVLKELGKDDETTDEPKTWTRSPAPEIAEARPSLTFQKVDIREGYDKTGHSEIRLFGVTKAGNSILCRVRNFDHYFYYPAPTGFKEEDLIPFRDHINIFTLGKCTYRDLFTSPELSYEAGIPYFLRYMIDNEITALTWIKIPAKKYNIVKAEDIVSSCQIEVSVDEADLLICDTVDNREKYAPLRILSFDIETDIPKGENTFSDARYQPVIQIGNMVSNYGETTPFIRTIFTLGTCALISGSHVQSFEDERAMLMAWNKFFVEVDPDVVIGYNITQFDIPYLLRRAWALRLHEFPYLGRVKSIAQRFNFAKGRPNFFSCPGYDGRLILDVFHHIREHHPGLSGEGAYKLNGISLHFLGQKKEDISYKQIPILQKGDAYSRRDLAIYCMKDVYLPLRLFEKLKCFEIEVKEAQEAHIPFNAMRVWRPLKDIAKKCLDAIERRYVIADPV